MGHMKQLSTKCALMYDFVSSIPTLIITVQDITTPYGAPEHANCLHDKECLLLRVQGITNPCPGWESTSWETCRWVHCPARHESTEHRAMGLAMGAGREYIQEANQRRKVRKPATADSWSVVHPGSHPGSQSTKETRHQVHRTMNNWPGVHPGSQIN